MIRIVVLVHFQHGGQNKKHQSLNIMNIQQSDVKILNMVSQGSLKTKSNKPLWKKWYRTSVL